MLDEEQDSLALLNEILGGMSVDEGDFSQEWTAVFGDTEGINSGCERQTEAQEKEESFFLPSQLLDQSLKNLNSSVSGENLCKNKMWICLKTQTCFTYNI